MRVDVQPKMLVWALERARKRPRELEKKFPRLKKWLAGQEKPTFNQLEKLAHSTHTPFGYFFLPEPPEEPLPIPDLRTLKQRPQRPSPNLLDTIYAMQRRSSWLSEELREAEADPLPFVGAAKIQDDPTSIGREMRELVGLGNKWAAKVSTWQEAVSKLRRSIEKLGVLAVINSLVENNTHRKLDVAEFRGFALVDPYAPLIFVNGADAKSAQMFTLAHEFAHLWLGSQGEGLSGFEGIFPGDDRVERFCDHAAAEFLVPEKELTEQWPRYMKEDDLFIKLARHFKVSPIVVARRALDLELLNRKAFFDFYNTYIEREAKLSKTYKGDFYNNQNARVGIRFARQVIHAALERRITFKEAYELTGLRGGSFQKYAKHVGVTLT